MSKCADCQVKILELELIGANQRALGDMHEINLLRGQLEAANRRLESAEVVSNLALMAERQCEAPISLLPLVVEAMEVLALSQGHKMRFEQLEWAARRDAVLRDLQDLVEGK